MNSLILFIITIRRQHDTYITVAVPINHCQFDTLTVTV